MIRYANNITDITEEKLTGFFVGWPEHPTPQTHLQLLKNSSKIVLAMDDATSRVVGFITANSDGVLSAYIPLLEVLPKYQGQGIGTELITRMLKKLETLYMIDLICDPELQPFYSRFKMKSQTGMILRNYKYQAGTNIAINKEIK